MPELPEVEIGARNLARWSANTTVTSVTVCDARAVRSRLTSNPREHLPDGQARLEALLVSQPCGPLERHGKRAAWWFAGGGMLLHLGMTGKWVRRAGETPAHGKIRLELSGGQRLWFIDPRCFGCVVPLDGPNLTEALHQGLGPDAAQPLTGPSLAQRLSGRRAVKVALMDQAVIAGLGNIHAAEALFRAGIDPRTRCDRLDEQQLASLAAEIPAQIERALAVEGVGEITYLHEGKTQNPFSVYGRKGQPCPSCGGAVARFVQGGRSTFWCPSCQRG